MFGSISCCCIFNVVPGLMSIPVCVVLYDNVWDSVLIKTMGLIVCALFQLLYNYCFSNKSSVAFNFLCLENV